MKRIILSLLLLVGLSITLSAKDYIAAKKQITVFADTTTTDTYTIDNNKYDVFKSKTGAFYIWKVSKKTNKKYKYYLPKDVQKEMGRVYKEDK